MFDDPPIPSHYIVFSMEARRPWFNLVIPVANSAIIIRYNKDSAGSGPCPLIRSFQKMYLRKIAECLLRCLSVASLPLSLSKKKEKKRKKKES